MKNTLKVGFAAVALATAIPAFAAEEAEVVDEGAIGWTPIAFGLASPVQLPWGHAKWDVFGLNLNALYAGAAKTYGLGLGGLGYYGKDYMNGIQFAGLCSYNLKEVNGARVSLGANICKETVNGLQLGAFGYGPEFWGVDIEFLGGMYNDIWGIQVAGLANIVNHQCYGWMLALGVNMADITYGCQTALFNMSKELHGAQIGIINYADDCQWGFQVGIVNIIMSNTLKVLPIVNAYF